jgi:hypothetical protein
VLAELNSVPRSHMQTDAARVLEQKIHDMLFVPQSAAEVAHA